MRKVAVAIICKTPRAGQSKTRLSPPLRPEECAELSGCFIADLSATIARLARRGQADGHAVYTPAGSETELQRWIPKDFSLVVQGEGDLGARLAKGMTDLMALGYAGAILVNSDSPTLPLSILNAGVEAVLGGDRLVISPALDGGYTLIGLSVDHPHLFSNIPWSTDVVFARTLERAREIDLPVTELDPWYDVDDGATYAILEQELDGVRPAFAKGPLEDAPHTRGFVRRRRQASVAA